MIAIVSTYVFSAHACALKIKSITENEVADSKTESFIKAREPRQADRQLKPDSAGRGGLISESTERPTSRPAGAPDIRQDSPPAFVFCLLVEAVRFAIAAWEQMMATRLVKGGSGVLTL